MHKLLLFILFSLIVGSELAGCPDGCVCVKSTVRCMFLQLDKLPPNIPRGTTVLDLRFNNFKALPPDSFKGMNNLSTVHLDANPLVCNCKLMKFVERLKKNDKLREFSATCGHPADLKGKSLLAVKKSDLHCRKPTFLKEPEDLEIAMGETVLLHCVAEGDPKPDITWLHNGKHIVSPRNKSDHYFLMANGTLKINSVSDTDSGKYSCIAENVMGQTRTRSAYLKTESTPVVRNIRHVVKRARPRITVQPKDYSVAVGETVKLECRSRGQPQPSLRWTKNDLPLPRNTRIQFKELSGSLVIEKVQYSDRGLYRCTATNEGGSVSETGRLEVLDCDFTVKDRSSKE